MISVPRRRARAGHRAQRGGRRPRWRRPPSRAGSAPSSSRVSLFGLALAGTLAGPLTAHAGEAAAEPAPTPCRGAERAVPSGPLPVSILEGDVTAPVRACPSTEAQVGPSAAALVAESPPLGALGAAFRAGGSLRYPGGGEAFASAELARYRRVRSGAITSSNLSLGWASAGAAHPVYEDGAVRVAATTRLSGPAGPGLHQRGVPLYAEVGAAALWRLRAEIAVHGYAGALGGRNVGGGPTHWRGGGQVRVGAAYALAGLEVIAETGALLGYGAPLASAELAPGVRAPLGRDLALEVAAAFPVAGATRTDVGGALRVTWRP